MATVKLPPILPDLDTLIDTAIETGGETDRFDFKETLELDKDQHKVRLVRAIGAFGNTDEGGFIFIGISDDRQIVGLTKDIADLFDQTRINQIISRYLSPTPAIQIRKHERDGKQLVIIEVQPFTEVPSVVRQSVNYGDEKLIAGSILFRNPAAESSVLTAETDMRKLCDVIVKRRASTFVELVQKGTLGRIAPSKSEQFGGLRAIRQRADAEWPSAEEAPPYLEGAFSSAEDLDLTPKQLKSLIPNACIKTRDGFPIFKGDGNDVHRGTSWGWYGRLPFSALGEGSEPPSYLWMLSKQGAFLDREDLWEDSHDSVIPGGVGVFHVIGKIILLIRFLDSFAASLNLNDNESFRILTACNNVRNRYLADERTQHPSPGRFLRHAVEQRVEATVDVSLNILRESKKDIALALIEELAWQFGRDDYNRQALENLLSTAKDYLGKEYFLEE